MARNMRTPLKQYVDEALLAERPDYADADAEVVGVTESGAVIFESPKRGRYLLFQNETMVSRIPAPDEEPVEEAGPLAGVDFTERAGEIAFALLEAGRLDTEGLLAAKPSGKTGYTVKDVETYEIPESEE